MKVGAFLQKPPIGTPINWGHPLTRGLTTVLPLQEYKSNRFINAVDGTLGTIDDSFGVGHDNSGWTIGQAGYGVLPLGGSSKTITWKDPVVLTQDDDYTFFSIATFDASTADRVCFIRSVSNVVMMALNSANKLEMFNVGAIEAVTTNAITPVPGLPRTFTVARRAKTQFDFYYDGRLDSTVADVATAFTTGSTDWRMSAPGGTERLNGIIFFQLMWKRYLTQQEVESITNDPWQIFMPLSVIRRYIVNPPISLTPSDTLSLSDSVILAVPLPDLVLADSLNFADALNKAAGLLLSSSDSLLLSDSATNDPYNPNVASTLSLTDTVSVSLVNNLLSQALNDTIILSDALALQLYDNLLQSFSETFNLTEDVTVQLLPLILTKSISDTIALSDAIIISLGNVAINLAFSDTIAITDEHISSLVPSVVISLSDDLTNYLRRYLNDVI